MQNIDILVILGLLLPLGLELVHMKAYRGGKTIFVISGICLCLWSWYRTPSILASIGLESWSMFEIPLSKFDSIKARTLLRVGAILICIASTVSFWRLASNKEKENEAEELRRKKEHEELLQTINRLRPQKYTDEYINLFKKAKRILNKVKDLSLNTRPDIGVVLEISMYNSILREAILTTIGSQTKYDSFGSIESSNAGSAQQHATRHIRLIKLELKEIADFIELQELLANIQTDFSKKKSDGASRDEVVTLMLDHSGINEFRKQLSEVYSRRGNANMIRVYKSLNDPDRIIEDIQENHRLIENEIDKLR